MLRLLLTLLYKFTKLKQGEYPLSILYYHHVFPQKESYHCEDLCEKEFEQQIKFLKQHFNIIPIEKALDLQKKGWLPPKALAISFDDGYQDNYTIAAPILKKNNCPATFFISTQGVEQTYLWNDIVEQAIKTTKSATVPANIIGKELVINSKSEKISAFHCLVNKLKFMSNDIRSKQIIELTQALNVKEFSPTMMSKIQISDLHKQGFTIGAHTHSHTILTTESDKNSYQELVKNKKQLEKITNSPITLLAFPNGLYGRDFNQTHCDIAKKIGFKAAFSTNDGGAIQATLPYQVPRFMPYRKQLPLFALSIAKIAGEHV